MANMLTTQEMVPNSMEQVQVVQFSILWFHKKHQGNAIFFTSNISQGIVILHLSWFVDVQDNTKKQFTHLTWFTSFLGGPKSHTLYLHDLT